MNQKQMNKEIKECSRCGMATNTWELWEKGYAKFFLCPKCVDEVIQEIKGVKA
jgi:predicted RNA-binding Zn-ribbon protein involved in translation (DUF1610 family)